MKRGKITIYPQLILIAIFLMTSVPMSAQNSDEKAGVERACLNYLEGFYKGDSSKLIAGLSPKLLKFGYWKQKDSENYGSAGQMTYRAAIDYAKNVLAKKNFAKPDAPKEVEVLDIGSHIAAAKVTAWWGYDYLLLAKHDGTWMIEQVLWEGPLRKH